MTNTAKPAARLVPKAETRVISQKLEYWGEGVADFACEASLIVKALKEKLEKPTRANLPGIRADINALLDIQRTLQGINANCLEDLQDLKDRFSKTFTILDI